MSSLTLKRLCEAHQVTIEGCCEREDLLRRLQTSGVLEVLEEEGREGGREGGREERGQHDEDALRKSGRLPSSR
ncbi:hypothetical protein Naga_103067g1 [Nannochloropsis gaditana]|uniref:SAP domain-containing protein n=1 Tax=Nannochloropsis gaditana TaxID=72520 RepID=W7TI37_9STRA|nr:hypothetical protein Naga_103067g1 [Nannochloropsis gaditana]